ncbi:hypothetical protein DL770_005491 [Monosporascus sp. CRB-9-2]|nr:hypothetical protein DL770_005491 [Monosporascus sp. CRB-9-2]
MGSTAEELQSQWANPGDILTLLLLIGGDIVQKAIAQLVGYKVRLPGRLLRDYEIRRNVDPRSKDEGGRAESIRIDIFNLVGRREAYKDDADANVNLEEDLEELADISRWALEKPTRMPQNIDATPRKASPMPRWLASMSKEDGVPSWLEPLKPANVNQPTSNTPQASPSFKSGIRRWFAVDNNKRNDIIYAVGVHGALMELEKWVPTAGLAVAQTFFPAGLKYNDEGIRDNVHKKFWQRAYHTKSVRKRAEEKKEGRRENLAPC